MTPTELRQMLQAVQSGSLTVEQAQSRLERLPFADLEFARVDHHRALRQGVPEVVFAPKKTPAQVVAIARELASKSQTVLVTRVSEAQVEALRAAFPALEHHALARTAVVRGAQIPLRPGRVLLVTAGTSDLDVAEEARVTLDVCGVAVDTLVDVGVAGLHRLLSALDRLRSAQVVVVVAGMEGALASAVGGLVTAPVIAVPTSVGYGASFQGLAALLGMLTSCAAGVTCVNIDNGFGAAMAAVRLLDAAQRFAHQPTEVP